VRICAGIPTSQTSVPLLESAGMERSRISIPERRRTGCRANGCEGDPSCLVGRHPHRKSARSGHSGNLTNTSLRISERFPRRVSKMIQDSTPGGRPGDATSDAGPPRRNYFATCPGKMCVIDPETGNIAFSTNSAVPVYWAAVTVRPSSRRREPLGACVTN
jgi:hypothetical protein